MIYYFIKFFNNIISVYECSESKQTVLKNMGEDSHKFEYEVFWSWWKKKVEYQDEPSIFVVATDQDSFDVPDDIKISSATNIGNEHSYLFDDLPKSFKVLTKPEEIQYTIDLPEKIDSHVRKVPRNNNSLEDYFVRETSRLRS